MGDVTIDGPTFYKRLKKLYANWKDNRDTLWGNSSAVAIVVGGSSEEIRYLKSITLHLWLFGYELPDTVVVLLEGTLHVLTSQKKVTILQPLVEGALAGAGVTLELHVKPKAEDGSAQIGALFDMIRNASDSPVVGTLLKDKHTGKVVELFGALLQSSGLPTVDVGPALADVFTEKDPTEVLNAKKAALLASKVVGVFAQPRLESVVDDAKRIKHTKLGELTEEAVMDPSKVSVKLKADAVDVAYPPIWQSGGTYDLRLSAPNDESNLAHTGVILVSVGTRYASYCANVARTYVVNPTPRQEAEYAALLAAHEAAISALRPGASLAAPVAAAVKALQDRGQEAMVERLSKNLGFGIGLEFREGANLISTKNEAAVVRSNTVFNVCTSVANLEDPEIADPAHRIYSMQLADTVVVVGNGDKPPELATSNAPRAWDKISYTLNDAEAEADVGGLEDLTNGLPPSRKALRSDAQTDKSQEQLRKEKQDALVKAKNEETLRRLTAQAAGGTGAATTGGRKVSDVIAYRSLADMPQSRELMIQVDTKAEAVLVPVYGMLVPFHITTIKAVTHNSDADTAMIRVTFNCGPTYEPGVRHPNAIMIKELSFRSSDSRHAAQVVQSIKLMRSQVMQRDKERAERATLVQQERLAKGKRVYKLPDLWLRPGLGGKGRKVPGSLEAHGNGFRYSNPKGEQLDIMYRNIKHAFFQPSENEALTLLHFHLINPIMIGTKKHKDVQVYTEVMDVAQTLDAGRRSAYDPDEIEEEQRERDRRNKTNAEFQAFVKRVQELWEKDFPELQLEFDIPFRELAFSGVPHRTSCTVLPTVNCLVELIEMPFTVVSLEDIEIVSLERASLNLKNFDLCIVFKDFGREVLRIDAIPSKSLEKIKEWLTSVGIKYYESKLNLQWKPILKNILGDPESFVEQGGWEFLNMEASDGEGSEEASEGYAPSGSEAEDGSDDDDEEASSGDESLVDSDDDAGSGSEELDEDEEAGLDWDELEEEAKKDDRSREYSDDEDERRDKKRKGGGGGGGGRDRDTHDKHGNRLNSAGPPHKKRK